MIQITLNNCLGSKTTADPRNEPSSEHFPCKVLPHKKSFFNFLEQRNPSPQVSHY